jgi:hypothetical protein
MEIATVTAACSIPNASSLILERMLPSKTAPKLPIINKNTPTCSDTINSNTIDQTKRFIIGLYKDMAKADKKLLEEYGKVLEFDQAYKQIKCMDLDFEYLLLDFRKEEDFLYYNIHIRGNEHYYHLVLYRHGYENNNGLSFHNELDTLPPRQVSKKIYDKLLLQEKIYAPRWYISLFRYCCVK